MTTNPVCCPLSTTLAQVARLMAQNDCGEIPVVDGGDQPIGVITDRDIVCRAVADGKDPKQHTVEEFMSQPIVTVRTDTPIDEVLSLMEKHQIRRMPVVDDKGACLGIIAQADVAWSRGEREVAELVREVSREAAR